MSDKQHENEDEDDAGKEDNDSEGNGYAGVALYAKRPS
jgi:hypothetical protein